MGREGQKKEHAKIVEAARGNLDGAADFTGIDYSHIGDDVIGRAARCAQILFTTGDSWLTDPGAAAGLIACYMQGAVDASKSEEVSANKCAHATQTVKDGETYCARCGKTISWVSSPRKGTEETS